MNLYPHVPYQIPSPRDVPLRRPDRHRHGGRRPPPQTSSRRHGHLHHRPQHQLHQLLHRVLHLLRLLPPPERPRRQRGLHPRDRHHLRKNPRDRRTRRHRRPHARRPSSRPQNRLARKNAARNQRSLPANPSALLLRIRNHRHRRIQLSQHPRHHPPPARCRTRFHPRRRR